MLIFCVSVLITAVPFGSISVILLSHTCTCCFCVLSMFGSMLSGPSTLIISSFSLSHGPNWLAAEAKLPSLSAQVSSSVCLWAAAWLAVCQRKSGEMANQERSARNLYHMQNFDECVYIFHCSIFIVLCLLSSFLLQLMGRFNQTVMVKKPPKASWFKPDSKWITLIKQ